MRREWIDRQEADRLLNEAIAAFQRFVVHSQKAYYKQDSDKATEIDTGFGYFKRFIERLGKI